MRVEPLRAFAVVLLFAALHAQAHGAGALAEEGTMSGLEQAVAVVSTAEAAQARVGQRVLVRGTARDARLGAVIVGEDLHVYCLALERWPAGLAGRQVEAEGLLEQSGEFAVPGDGTAAGTEGPVWVLRDCSPRR